MLSKNKIKYIRSLELKKNRKETQTFLAEGHKLVGDLLGRFPCRLLVATETWLRMHPNVQADETIEVKQEELSRASLLKTPQDVLAVFYMPCHRFGPEVAETDLCLALDGVQDPGNVGTILRVADWFGIRHLFCSPDTADAYSPKVVQATMGALARVKTVYCDLPALLREVSGKGIPIFGTFLDGDNIYDSVLDRKGIIVMGNEGNGISAQVAEHVSHHLLIPNFPPGTETSESLNVAVAAAITCAEFRRREY